MREIKFRAWSKKYNRMFYSASPSDAQTLGAQITDSCTAKFFEKFYGQNIMQYTGLEDKNGKEIYEGDVVQDSHGYKARIEYSDGAFILIIEGRFPDTDMAGEGNNKFYEVIGNIWENPELLKG